MELRIFEGFKVLDCLKGLKVKVNNGLKVVTGLKVFNSLKGLQ